MLAKLTAEERRKIAAEERRAAADAQAEAESGRPSTKAEAATQDATRRTTTHRPPPAAAEGCAGPGLRPSPARQALPATPPPGPNAYDCSGLTYAAWKSVGVSLPRSSRSQYGAGSYVSRSNLQPGDLVFFYSPISHVALYAGNGQIIHAPRPGKSRRVHKHELHAVRGRQASRLTLLLPRIRRVLVLGAAVLVASAAARRASSTASADAAARPRAAADRLAQVRRDRRGPGPGRAGRRPAGLLPRLVSDRDPTFASRVRLLYANLSTLPLAELHLARRSRASGRCRPSRQAVLGPDAWVQPVRRQLAARRGRAAGPPSRLAHLRARNRARSRLAGTFDRPPDRAAPGSCQAGGSGP